MGWANPSSHSTSAVLPSPAAPLRNSAVIDTERSRRRCCSRLSTTCSRSTKRLNEWPSGPLTSSGSPPQRSLASNQSLSLSSRPLSCAGSIREPCPPASTSDPRIARQAVASDLTVLGAFLGFVHCLVVFTSARLSERQPDEPSSSSTPTWPGSSPAKATRPDPLGPVNHWKARLCPARVRLPISVAVPSAAFKKPPSLCRACFDVCSPRFHLER
jgi:hypothetical protein